MKRFLMAATAATAAVLFLAGPAMAHEEINPSTIPTGKPTFFSLSAANEKTSDLTRIAVTAPAGVPFGATTRQPPGWTVDKSDAQITWTGGKVAPDNFEQWGFEIDSADQPGVLKYKVTMGFADSTSDDVEVDVTAVAAGTSATTVAPSTPSSPTTGAATPATKSSDSSNGLAVAALIVAVLAGILAGVALVATRRGRPGGSGGDDGATGAEGAAKGQDW